MNRVCHVLVVCLLFLAAAPASAAAFSLTFTYTTPGYLRPQDSVRLDVSIFGSVFKRATVVGPNQTISIVVPNAVNFPHGVSVYRVPNSVPPLAFSFLDGPGVVRVRKDSTDLGPLPMIILRGEFPDPGNGAVGITGFFE
jgi:hypothetical protein